MTNFLGEREAGSPLDERILAAATAAAIAADAYFYGGYGYYASPGVAYYGGPGYYGYPAVRYGW